jgi:putative inorganic carbon (HCO3(-)) transporter
MQSFARFLCDAEIWFVTAAIAASMVQPDYLLPALIVILLFWLVRRAAGLPWGVRTPLDVPSLLLGGMAAVAWRVSALPEKSLPQVIRLLTGIGFYYAIVNWAGTARRVQGLVWGAAGAVLGLSAYAVISVEWTQTKLSFLPASLYDPFLMLVSDFVHPNVLGGTLALFLAGLAALLLWGLGKIPGVRLLGGGLVYLGMAGILLLSQSRSALLAVGAAGLLLLALRWRWGWLGIAGAAGAAWFVFARLGAQRVEALLLGSPVVGGIRGRLEIWERAGWMIRDFPLTGVGMGLYGEAADRLYPFLGIEPGAIPHAHNLFLQIGVDLGLPGLAAWLAAFGIVWWMGWRLYRRGTQAAAWAAGIGAGTLAVQTALLVHGLFDAVTWGLVKPAPLVWGLWGVTAAAWRVWGAEGTAAA